MPVLTVVPGSASHKNSSPLVQWVDAIYCYPSAAVQLCQGVRSQFGYVPACETDSPASSMSWSMENAQVLISS